MTELSEKIKLIYKPFLIVAIVFIAAYTFLHWILFIKLGISIKEDIVNFALPFFLPFIPILIWLRPRIRLLQFKKDEGSFTFQLLACIAIAFPTIIAQDYLITATGKLTSIEKISEIENEEITKYYTLRNCYLDKQRISVYNTVSVSGKHNRDYNMDINITVPIFDNISDTSKLTCNYWLGIKYQETISNRFSSKDKDELFQRFATKTQKEFDATNFNNFNYLEVIGNNEKHEDFNTAIENSEVVTGNQPIVFVAQNEPFENRNGSSFEWIFGSLAIGFSVIFLLLLVPKFKVNELKRFKEGKRIRDTEYKDLLELFIPKDEYFITPIIMNINILIFLLMVIAGLGFMNFKGNDLLNWGGNYRPETINGQSWRLVTNIFMHGGFMHIFTNMIGFLFVGTFLEPILGRKKFVFIYLTTGILASIASVYWYVATVSVGASGAIFGLYGFFIAALLLKVFPKDFSKLFLSISLIFVGYNLIMGLTGGIDNAAHIGGLISGFILGLFMSGQLKKNSELQNF